MEGLDIDALVAEHGLTRDEAAEVVRRMKSTRLEPWAPLEYLKRGYLQKSPKDKSYVFKPYVVLGDLPCQETPMIIFLKYRGVTNNYILYIYMYIYGLYIAKDETPPTKKPSSPRSTPGKAWELFRFCGSIAFVFWVLPPYIYSK